MIGLCICFYSFSVSLDTGFPHQVAWVHNDSNIPLCLCCCLQEVKPLFFFSWLFYISLLFEPQEHLILYMKKIGFMQNFFYHCETFYRFYRFFLLIILLCLIAVVSIFSLKIPDMPHLFYSIYFLSTPSSLSYALLYSLKSAFSKISKNLLTAKFWLFYMMVPISTSLDMTDDGEDNRRISWFTDLCLLIISLREKNLQFIAIANF